MKMDTEMWCDLLVNERNQRDLEGAWLGSSFGLLHFAGRVLLPHCSELYY